MTEMKQSKKAEKRLEARKNNFKSSKLESKSGYHMPGSIKRKK